MGSIYYQWGVSSSQSKMRPIKAVIIAASKKTGLKIRTESGLIKILPYNEKYYIGQEILVAYDFTKNRITHIIQNYHEEGTPETIQIEKEEQEDETLELLSWFSDTKYDL